MLKNRQKGAIDMMFVLVLVIVVAVGGFVLWRISSADETEPIEQTIVTKDETQETEEEVEESKNPTYENEEFGFSFEYPEGWTIEEQERYGSAYAYYYIVSPDFKLEDAPHCAGIESGYRFTVGIQYKDVEDNYVQTYSTGGPKEGPEWAVKNSSLGKLAGLDAAVYRTSPGECGYTLVTGTVKNGIKYSVNSYTGGTELDEYQDEYDLVVESFEIN